MAKRRKNSGLKSEIEKEIYYRFIHDEDISFSATDFLLEPSNDSQNDNLGKLDKDDVVKMSVFKRFWMWLCKNAAAVAIIMTIVIPLATTFVNTVIKVNVLEERIANIEELVEKEDNYYIDSQIEILRKELENNDFEKLHDLELRLSKLEYQISEE